jgi:hypothetical protein
MTTKNKYRYFWVIEQLDINSDIWWPCHGFESRSSARDTVWYLKDGDRSKRKYRIRKYFPFITR